MSFAEDFRMEAALLSNKVLLIPGKEYSLKEAQELCKKASDNIRLAKDLSNAPHPEDR